MKGYVISALIGAFFLWLLGCLPNHAWWISTLVLGYIGLFGGRNLIVFFVLAFVGCLLGIAVWYCHEFVKQLVGNIGFLIIGGLLGITTQYFIRKIRVP